MKESKQVKKIVFPTDYHPVCLSDTDIDSSHAVEEQSSNNDNTKPSWKNEEEWFRTIIHRPSFIDHISLKKYLRCSDPIINKYIKPEVHYLSTTPQGIINESHVFYDLGELTKFLKNTTKVMRRTIMINMYDYPDLITEETINKVQRYLNLNKKSNPATRKSLEEYLKEKFAPFYFAHVKVNKKSTAKLYTQCELFPYPYEGSLLDDKFISKEDLIIKNEGNTDLRPLSLRSETIDKILFETAMIEIDYFCISDTGEETQTQNESSNLSPKVKESEENASKNTSTESINTPRLNRKSRLFLREEKYEEKKAHFDSDNNPGQWVRVGYEYWLDFIKPIQELQNNNSQNSTEKSNGTPEDEHTENHPQEQELDIITKRMENSFISKIGYTNETDKPYNPDPTIIEIYSSQPDSMISGNGIYFRLMYDIFSHTNNRIFLTGKAGTGKTTMTCVLIRLLQHIGKKLMLCATTGTAAYNINQNLEQMPSLKEKLQCRTVHTAFKIKEKVFPYTTEGSDDIPELINSDAIIIDEISMMRMDVFRYVMRSINKAEALCRQKFYETHSKDEIYKGKQVILVGDFFQLPPVITDTDVFYLNINHWPKDWIEKGGYAFFAPEWKDSGFITYKLEEPFRQKGEQGFLELLDKIRFNNLDAKGYLDNNTKTTLNRRYQSYVLSKRMRNNTIHLFGHKADVEAHNIFMQGKLQGPSRTYNATSKIGSYELSNEELDLYNIESPLMLKVGDKIITTKNDPHHRYHNGRFGTVEELTDDYVKVKFSNGELCNIERVEYVISDATLNEPYTASNTISPKVKVIINQFPLRLAYAITIHKAQGMTLESACIDPGSWENGQLYTALSRLKSLNDLYLLRKISNSMLKKSLRTSNEVIAFDQGKQSIGISSPPSEEGLSNSPRIFDIIRISSVIKQKVYDHASISKLSPEMLEKLYELTKQALDIIIPPDDATDKTGYTSKSADEPAKTESTTSSENSSSDAK